MALTAAQKSKVLQLLGYPGGSIDTASVLYDKILSDRLVVITADTESLVVDQLANILTLETQMSEAPARFIAEQVGDIRLNTNEIEKLRKERKMVSREIGRLLDIPFLGGNSGICVVV